MKTIKFRAWDKQIEIMCEPHDFEWLLKNGAKAYFGYSKASHGPKMKLEIGTQFRNLEWMQFTGLKDKNGKEIFEGDIVKIWYQSGGLNVRVEEWDEESAAFYPGGMGANYKKQEVIGNIYENPELLK